MADLQDLDDLILGLREDHDHGGLSVCRQTIALVRPQILTFIEHRFGRQKGAQFGDKFEWLHELEGLLNLVIGQSF